MRGTGQYLFDDTGRRYIDAYNNVPHVGHSHPHVVRAAAEQLGVLNTNTRYLHDSVNRLAERICATLPAQLSVCWFVNSGSEANELALRLARAHTGRRDMIVLAAAYHGNTTTLIDISPYKHAGPGGRGAPDWVHTVPIPDVYRGVHKASDPRAGANYAAYVHEITRLLAERGTALAGYIAESLPSVGGQIVFPRGYLAAVYRHVREVGGVCIADEVQTGYGRIGTHFWGFESQDVVPDIVVLGKPIGNGYPICAVVTTPEIAESLDNGMEFFSTSAAARWRAVGPRCPTVRMKHCRRTRSRSASACTLAGWVTATAGTIRWRARLRIVSRLRARARQVDAGARRRRGLVRGEPDARGGNPARHRRTLSQCREDPPADAVLE